MPGLGVTGIHHRDTEDTEGGEEFFDFCFHVEYWDMGYGFNRKGRKGTQRRITNDEI